jgi:hypothetical protein
MAIVAPYRNSKRDRHDTIDANSTPNNRNPVFILYNYLTIGAYNKRECYRKEYAAAIRWHGNNIISFITRDV